MAEIFLDSATSTKPLQKVVEAMNPYFSTYIASPQAPYVTQEYEAQKEAYNAIFSFFQAKEEDHFVCTSSTSECYALLFHSLLKCVVQRTGKNHFVVSPFEGAGLTLSSYYLQEEACEVTKLSNIRINTVEEALTSRTVLVSISLADPITGAIFDLHDIRDLCQKRGIFLHIDISHALGKIHCTLDDIGADYITFEGYPLHAPKGVAGIFVRKGAPLKALFHGEREETFRGGFSSLPLLVAFAKACSEGETTILRYGTEVARLRFLFEEMLQSKCPDVTILYPEARLPHVSVVVFPKVRNEHMAYALFQKKVYVNIGGGPFQIIDELLRAYGYTAPEALSAISFSLSIDTTEEEIKEVVHTICNIYEDFKKL